jgi:hypothetical protein
MAQQNFAIVGKTTLNPNWDGLPVTLGQFDSVTMPQTPNESTVLAWLNVGTQNIDGTVVLTSGGAQPLSFDAPPAQTAPSLWIYNWQANDVTLTNVSVLPTPIWVEMLGPGIPGTTPQPLQVGVPLQLPSLGTAQGQAPAMWMLLQLQATPGNTSTVAVLGGPSGVGGSNGHLYGMNMPSPPPSPTPYTKTTAGNTLTVGPFKGDGSQIFVANMSAQAAGPVQVLLQTL